MKVKDRILEVKGPKGVLSLELPHEITVLVGEKEITIEQAKEFERVKRARAIWGLTRALINNMVIGVKEGYEKELELQGVGFRMSVQGKKVVMALGFSHPVEIEIPEGLSAEVKENNILAVKGINKQAVGQFAANVRALKKAEPYKGKGFRYVGEKVKRKVGKKAGAVK